MTNAAVLALVGIDPWRYLTTTDRDERAVLVAVARRSWELLDIAHRNLAVHIVNTYVRSQRRA